jgi:hypothetical protein
MNCASHATLGEWPLGLGEWMNEQCSAGSSDVSRSFAWWVVALVAWVGPTGCQSLDVSPFAGTNASLELKGSSVSQPGQHFEMWGRNSDNDILRIGYRATPTATQIFGFMIRIAVPPTDPCMINDSGYVVTDPRAYPGNITVAGVTQTPTEQAEAISVIIREVTAVSLGGQQQSNLLLATAYDATPEPQLTTDATPAERRAACNAYWAASPYSYTAAPLTLTDPMHGMALGPIDYSTSAPLNSFSTMPFVNSYDLSNLQEFWITLESVPPESVDPLNRGPAYLQGNRVNRGNDTINFDLTGSDPSVSGSLLLIPAASGE